MADVALISQIHSAAANPLTAPSNSILTSPHVSNLTVPGVIPSRFRTVLSGQGTRDLDIDAGLMAIAKMMHRLTSTSFSGTIEPRTYVNKDYPGVSVSIKAIPGENEIETRFAVWGIFEASHYVTRDKIMKNFTFTLVFDNSDVGYIVFAWNRVPPSLTGSGSNSQNQTNDSAVLSLPQRTAYAGNSSSATLMSPEDNDITLSLNFVRGRPLTKFKIFAEIFTGLVIAAEFPPHQKIQKTFHLRAPPYPETRINFKPKGSIPIFEYSHVAIALISAGKFVLDMDVYAMLLISIIMDQESIGEILIFQPDRATDLQDEES